VVALRPTATGVFWITGCRLTCRSIGSAEWVTRRLASASASGGGSSADFDAVSALYSAVAAEGLWIGAEAPVEWTSQRREAWCRTADKEDRGAWFLANADAAQLVGYLAVIRAGVEHADFGVAVAAAHRGLGVGGALLDAAVAWCQAATLSKINCATIALYPYRVWAIWQPAMLTLTYPGDWLTVPPTADAAKRHFWALCKRYARAWGEELIGPWKQEFQARGARHFHISTTPPMGFRDITDPDTGQQREVDFKTWLSITWAEIVNHPDPEQRRNHQAAGTGVDYAQGIKLNDPRRMAVYFANYGTAGSKEYQHRVPTSG
jgi:GNAT superfamily N-acetyltransferase